MTSKRAWALAVAVFLGVSALMLWPLSPSTVAPGWPHFDKVVHFVAWLAMAVAVWPALKASRAAAWRRAFQMRNSVVSVAPMGPPRLPSAGYAVRGTSCGPRHDLPFQVSSRRSRMRRVTMVVGALTAWGVAVELIQIAIPRRSADLLDALADVAGALVGALVMARIEAARVSGRANAEEATG
jgi:VanZ family protein